MNDTPETGTLYKEFNIGNIKVQQRYLMAGTFKKKQLGWVFNIYNKYLTLNNFETLTLEKALNEMESVAITNLENAKNALLDVKEAKKILNNGFKYDRNF